MSGLWAVCRIEAISELGCRSGWIRVAVRAVAIVVAGLIAERVHTFVHPANAALGLAAESGPRRAPPRTWWPPTTSASAGGKRRRALLGFTACLKMGWDESCIAMGLVISAPRQLLC